MFKALCHSALTILRQLKETIMTTPLNAVLFFGHPQNRLAQTVFVMLVFGLIFQGAQAQHAQHHAHKHGHATLQVSLEKDRLSLQFLSPMDNLVGFEHAPKTERQVKALDDLQRLLENPFNLFEPNKEALCKRDQVVIQSKLLGKGDPVALQKDGHGHADLRYEARFRCATPSLLTTINVTAFRAFRRLHEIDVELVADRPGGLARSFELNRKQLRIEF
jgi:hypothetical protein